MTAPPDSPTPRGASRWHPLLADGAAIALLLLLVALFFWRLWAPNPADRVAFPVGDFTDQYYPLRHWVAATLAEGRLPFWNPYLFGGQPGLADPQAAVFYPPAVANALLWGADFPLLALELEAVAHIALAACGTYAFVRVAMALGRVPALVGAATFAFSGYLTGFPLEQITILETSAWLPWLLLAIERAARPAVVPLRHRLRWVAAGALVLALALLAGHPQSALYLLYGSAAFALLQVALPSFRTTLTASRLPRAAVLLLFPLGIGLAAAQLLPTVHFIALSSREMLDYNFVRGGLSWEEFTTLFLPKVVGSTPLYGGILALLLAPLGLEGDRRSEKRFWAGVALLSLFLAAGGNSFLFDLGYLGLPGLARVRSQERVLLLWVWALALLAAWGAAALLRAPASAQERIQGYVRGLTRLLPVLLLPWLALWMVRALSISRFSVNLEVLDSFFTRYSFFWLLFLLGWALLRWASHATDGTRRSNIAGVLLVALLLWDLFSVTRAPHLGGPLEEALPGRTPVVEALLAQQTNGPSRVAVVGQVRPRSNDGMLWGLPLLSGNEPLRLAATERFFGSAPPWAQLQAMGAGFLVADSNLAESDPDAYELLAMHPDPPSYLIRVRPPMPYAWLVGQAEVLPTPDAIVARLQQGGWDAHAVALVEEPLPLSGASYAPGEHVTVRRHAPGLAELQVVAPETALLVVAEVAVEGWHLSVDGQPTPWLRANGLNIAVPLPPGEHLVRLHYEPPGLRAGLAVSGVSAVVLLGLLWPRRRGVGMRPTFRKGNLK